MVLISVVLLVMLAGLICTVWEVHLDLKRTATGLCEINNTLRGIDGRLDALWHLEYNKAVRDR